MENNDENWLSTGHPAADKLLLDYAKNILSADNLPVGMAAGILFCILGVVMVIPTFGFFGIIWTFIAVVITVINGINVFSEGGVATHEIVIEDREQNVDDRAGLSFKKSEVQERLHLLEELYAEGSITKEELDQKRKKILDEI